MTASLYRPADGLVALDDDQLGALLAHAQGRPVPPAQRSWLASTDIVRGDEIDAPLRPVVAALLGAGPRLRLQSRQRGELTFNDAALPARADGSVGRQEGVALVVRPPGVAVAYVRSLSRGTLARHLARRMGIGAHLLATRPLERAVEVADWPSVRAAFDAATASPSGWAAEYQETELHELRWAGGPGQPARTALALARLDGALAEVRPKDGPDSAYVVQPAEPRSLWLRLCRLLSATR